MAIDRRDFVRLGAVGTAGLVTSSCDWLFGKKPSADLRIVTTGLCYIDRHAKSIDVHLLDAGQFAMMAHQSVISVLTSDRDSTTTAPSVADQWDAARVVFDISGKKVTLDSGSAGGPDLTYEDQAIGSVLPSADDDDHWKSIQYAPRIAAIAKVANPTIDSSKVTATVTLEHGHFRSLHPLRPDGKASLGSSAIWAFTDAGNNPVAPAQAMTNRVLCTVPASGATATFIVGSQKIVVNLPTEVIIRNLIPKGMPDNCSGTSPCAEHMGAYFALINAPSPPKVMYQQGTTPSPGVEPNYCPPGI